jgi:hypothetical protein
MYEDLQKAGINPVPHRLDNETSKDLIKEIENKGLTYQVASPVRSSTEPCRKSNSNLQKPLHYNTVWNRQWLSS